MIIPGMGPSLMPSDEGGPATLEAYLTYEWTTHHRGYSRTGASNVGDLEPDEFDGVFVLALRNDSNNRLFLTFDAIVDESFFDELETSLGVLTPATADYIGPWGATFPNATLFRWPSSVAGALGSSQWIRIERFE